MSAGDGYRYLLSSIAAGDGQRSLATPLTRYYQADGTPPGRWLGSGLAELGDGSLRPGDLVTEEQLALLIGAGRDPLIGQPLGHAYPVYPTLAERVARRVAALNPSLDAPARAAAVAGIEAEEAARGSRRAVAGYDFTFSIPKSASVLWGVADAETQAVIAQAHHAAVAQVVAFLEREVAATRTGATTRSTDGAAGAVAQLEVTGVIAAGFDHFDSRAGDPHLHTHVVISNKVRTVLDGKWRSLDGRPLHAATVALSELHEAVFADHLTRALGVGWEQRQQGADRNPAWEITGVPSDLVSEFSSRSRDIDVEKDRLINEYRQRHGHEPSPTTVIKLRAQATLATRPDKNVRPLSELTAAWRERAGRLLGQDATAWARAVVANDAPLLLHASDIPSDVIERLGRDVVAVVGDKRSTWRRWNLAAEAARQTMTYRMATTTGRETLLTAVTDAAERASIRLTPPELASSPPEFLRPEGASVFRPKHSAKFTSQALLDAEDALLTLSRDLSAPTAPATPMPAGGGRDGLRLSANQQAVVAAIASSGRRFDVLIGPAGAGKTTTMTALRSVWEAEHGAGSVVGLAPSAAAAQVLAEELGIGCENTAKWLHQHHTTGQRLRRGQLVVLDEATLAGTHILHQIAEHAALVGAKVLLVGDPAQLQAVQAGGAFALLVQDRPDAASLHDVQRFTNPWEGEASLQLRNGEPTAIPTYLTHDRVQDGDTEAMLDAAYTAWQADQQAGRSSILLADNTDTVRALNERAHAERVLNGQVNTDREIRLGDGTRAAVGDLIITRRNNRRLVTARGRGWVRNGDRWTITNIHHDGSITAQRERTGRNGAGSAGGGVAGKARGASVSLPADYVAEHVDLGYAVTTHRAQGITVEAAHVLVRAGMVRENLYVGMTRGRASNIAYVALDQPDPEHDAQQPGQPETPTAATILTGILANTGAETSAHQTLVDEQERWGSIAQLAAEYETLAAAAQHTHWSTLIRNCGLAAQQAEQVLTSEAFGPLCAALRRAEAHGHRPETLLPRLITQRPLAGVEDIAAVLHHRLTETTTQPTNSRTRRAPKFIAGLIPHADGPMPDDMRQALTERRDLIESRADAVLTRALQHREGWTRHLGPQPAEALSARRWREHARTVAAYRDRYAITTATPLGSPANSQAQQADAVQAHKALRHARAVADQAAANQSGFSRSSGREHTGPAM